MSAYSRTDSNPCCAALANVEPHYSSEPPFHPDEYVPEYPFARSFVSTTPNPAYRGVRQALFLLGLDRKNYGTAAWNPLGELIQPGQTVVVKPNWVNHTLKSNWPATDLLITHPSVIRAVLDYVFIANRGQGTVIVGDAPIQSANFAEIVTCSRIGHIVDFFAQEGQFPLYVRDFRQTICKVTSSGRILPCAQPDPDPAGYREVDLGSESFLEPISDQAGRFRVLDYAPSELQTNHKKGVHRYLIAGSVLQADVVISVPKLKTHGKTGMTGALKNLVGINGDKAFLPHFRVGPPTAGGDEYAQPSLLQSLRSEVRSRLVMSRFDRLWRLSRWLGRRTLATAQRLHSSATVGGRHRYEISSGHWHGNDTTWRMVLDLNRLLAFANKDGQMTNTVQRTIFSIVDAIVAGERNGPLSPDARYTGAILAGGSAVTVDIAAAHLMGFDWTKVRLLRRAHDCLGPGFPTKETAPLHVVTATDSTPLSDLATNWSFRAPDGWRGYIEREPQENANSQPAEASTR
jgi:uncharacterized protein (DUF362 family)